MSRCWAIRPHEADHRRSGCKVPGTKSVPAVEGLMWLVGAVLTVNNTTGLNDGMVDQLGGRFERRDVYSCSEAHSRD
jgi:hypothetical protein